MSKNINLLVSTIPGLGLAPTAVFNLPRDSTVSSALALLKTRIPALSHLVVTTPSNKVLTFSSTAPLTTLLSSPTDDLLTLRLSAPLCGGKGGFGSQLRADGGRMSTRKKRPGVDEHASSRNLDGRRIRTVAEAKNLAHYMITKPELERKAKEERRKRLEAIVESTERKQRQIETGQHVTLDGRWIEEKNKNLALLREMLLAKAELEEMEKEDSVAAEVEQEKEKDSAGASGSSEKGASTSSSGPISKPIAESGAQPSLPRETASTNDGKRSVSPLKVFGWEEDLDEFMSSSDEEEAGADTEPSEVSSGSSGASPSSSSPPPKDSH